MAPKKRAVASAAETKSEPEHKSAAEHPDVKGWQPVMVETKTAVQGGLLKQAQVLETIELLVGGRQEQFAKIKKMKVG